MNSSAQDIKELIEADSSLSLEFGVDLFIGDMPETPNECVALFDTGGSETTVGPYYRSSVQILLRGEVGGYSEVHDRAFSINALLYGYSGVPTSSSLYYTGIWSLGDPFYIGVDEENRPLFSINFRIQRR